MYQIISVTGDILCETDAPHYVKLNSDSNAWIPANSDDAECIVVDGKRFCIYGKPFLADAADVVFVKEFDAAAKLHNHSADILDICEAICELDRKQTVLFNAFGALNKKMELISNA